MIQQKVRKKKRPILMLIFSTISQKSWEMLFISPRKLFSFFRYLTFCLSFRSCRKMVCLKRLISKFLTSKPGKQTIAIHLRIVQYFKKLRQSDNEIWLVNRTWQTFFLKNHTQNVVEKLFLDPFLKSKIDQISVWFYCITSRELSKYVETKLQITCFYLI